MDSKEDIAKLTCILRNPNEKVLRIIYLKDNNIIEYETIGIIKGKAIDTNLIRQTIINLAKKMYKLNANGYYLAYNSNSEKIKITFKERIKIKEINKQLPGFKEYIKIDSERYSRISIKHNREIISKRRLNNKTFGKDPTKYIKENPIINIEIKNIEDLTRLVDNIKNSCNYSTLILIDNKNQIKTIKDIPNSFINQPYNTIEEYIKKTKNINKSNKAYLITNRKDFLERTIPLIKKNIIEDCITYIIATNKIFIKYINNKNGGKL